MAERRKIRVLIVDDHPVVRFGIAAIVGSQPDMVVVDLMLPDTNGLDLARELRRSVPDMKILVITAHPSERLPADLMAIGVNGYVDKTEPIEYVLSAVETVRAGGMFFASRVRAQSGSVQAGDD